jgi:hypothetical protein
MQNYRDFGLFPSSGILENRTFRKQIQSPKRHVFYFLENGTIEKVQKAFNSVCYTPSSEPFGLYNYIQQF